MIRRPCGDDCNRSTCSETRCYGRIPWGELPCREFCNAYARGRCAPGRCGSPYERSNPRRWLGRGSEDVPGKSFGWAHHMEREAIRAHLLKRGMTDGAALYFRTSKIQQRLQRDYHRRKPRIGVRRKAPPVPTKDFTLEELERIAEHFAGANDPVAQAIREKALARL